MPPAGHPFTPDVDPTGVVGLAAGRGGTGTPAEGAVVGERAVLAELGARPEQADLTVVQFSTAFCGPCRATRARIQQLQTTRPGLRYRHADAESHLDEVRALDVRRTPTLFYLDRAGTVIGRSS